VWMNRNGTAAPVDAGWHGTFSDPALSPDGKRLAVAIANDVTRVSEVWTKDLDTGPAVKFTVDGGGRFPSWTPDGQSISYASSGAKGFRLWTKRADGSGAAIQMLNADREFVDPRWSADGKWLVFRTPGVGPRAGDILGVRVGVDSTPIPLVAGPFQESEHALSPDGRWLAYTSLESGRSQVYVVPFPNTTAAKWIVSTDGGASPAWSHRGRELFYLDDGGNLISVQVKTDLTFSMGPATTLFAWPAATSVVQTQGTFIGAGRRQFDVAPDDQRFLMLRSVGGSEAERLVMVDNWFAELRAKETRTP
jgi:eukaryotic-like serine/threonine-protein kinase